MKKSKRLFFSLIAVLILAAPCSAQIRPKTFSFAPFIGGYTFEGNEDLETKPGYGARLGYDLTRRWGVEGVFDYAETGSKQGLFDADMYSYRLEGLYHFLP